jgi:hypothetical protein
MKLAEKGANSSVENNNGKTVLKLLEKTNGFGFEIFPSKHG